MLAIASLLDPETDQQTRDLWQFLEEKCGLYEIKTAPYPHYSWLGCDDIQWKPATQKLKRISLSIKGFTVRTAGFGIFSGPIPVLFVSIVKTPELMEIHRKIWERLEGNLIGPQAYYSPERWMPHITIAHGDLTPENLCCAVQDLAFQRVEFEIFVNNVSIIYHNEEGVGVKYKFDLTK